MAEKAGISHWWPVNSCLMAGGPKKRWWPTRGQLVAQAFFSGLTRSFRFRLFGAARNKQGVDCHIHSRFWSTKLDSDRFLLLEGSFRASTRAGMWHTPVDSQNGLMPTVTWQLPSVVPGPPSPRKAPQLTFSKKKNSRIQKVSNSFP